MTSYQKAGHFLQAGQAGSWNTTALPPRVKTGKGCAPPGEGGERQIDKEVRDASPELRRAYLIKEEFRTIFEGINDPQRAARFLKAWVWKAFQTGDHYLAKFVNTLPTGGRTS